MSEDLSPIRGDRGGNSWRSIPAGADVHPGYVTDHWPEDAAEPPATPDEQVTEEPGD